MKNQTSNKFGTWSTIAKFIDMKAKDHDLKEKVREKEKKKIFNESLNYQLKQRELFCKKENEIEKTLLKNQLDQFKTLEGRDKQKQEERLKKIKLERERIIMLNLGK